MGTKTNVYDEFALYYDFLGWNRFSRVCAERLKNFVRFRGRGRETILDLACGTGELEYSLRRSGLRFTGVDLSKQMLARARSKVDGVRFIRDDITAVRLQKTFDITVCLFDSVNHLGGITPVEKLFKTAKIHLRDGGYFIFDMLTPEGLAHWGSVDIKRGKDHVVIIDGEFDSEKILAEISIEGFVRSGKNSFRRFMQKIRERSYPFETVVGALANAGFNHITVSSYEPDQPLATASRWFFIVS